MGRKRFWARVRSGTARGTDLSHLDRSRECPRTALITAAPPPPRGNARYWRGRTETPYGPREDRIWSLLSFACAEVGAVAGTLGDRGPGHLDKDRRRLMALGRRLRAEAASEEGPLPIAFPRQQPQPLQAAAPGRRAAGAGGAQQSP